MNILLTNLLLSIGLVSFSAASKARYPYALDKDLEIFGNSNEYNSVLQLEVVRGVEHRICSAVRVENFLLTAAHCLKNVSSISILQSESNVESLEKVTGYFMHPYYEQNPIDDLAVIWTTLSANTGYRLSTQTNLKANEDFVSVGFGNMRDGSSHTKQAFNICGQLILDEKTFLIQEHFNPKIHSINNKQCGTLTSGDSGGALLRDTDSGKELIGISINADDNSYWRMVDSSFVELIQKVSNIANKNANNDSVQDHTSLAKSIFSPIEESDLLQHPRVLYLKGNKAVSAGNYEEAISLYQQLPAHEIAPNLCYTFLNRAIKKNQDLPAKELQICKSFADLTEFQSSLYTSIDNGFLANIQYILYARYHSTLRAGFGKIVEELSGYKNSDRSITEGYLKKAAYNGDLKAVAMYISSNYNKLSAQEVVQLYSKPAEKGDESSQYKLAIIYMPDHIYEALQQVKTRADYELDQLREATKSLEKDGPLMMLWLKSAVDASFADAQYVLGILTALGLDSSKKSSSSVLVTSENYVMTKEAVDLLTKASGDHHKNPSADAKDALCYIYLQDDSNKPLAYKQCLETMPEYILADGYGLEKKTEILAIIFQDLQQGNYLPQGNELEKLHKIQGMLTPYFENDKEYYQNSLGVDKADMFYNTELPKLLHDGAESQQPIHQDL